MCFPIFSVLSAFFVESCYFSAFSGQNKVVFFGGTLLHRVQQSLECCCHHDFIACLLDTSIQVHNLSSPGE